MMPNDYFRTLNEQTDSRFWINNPTLEEMKLSLEQGVFACTTNPAYCSRLIKEEPDYLNSVIDDLIGTIRDYDLLANEVYRTCARRVMEFFLPVFEKSDGKKGFVTLQSDPRHDEDTARLVDSVMQNRELAPNYMAKIPVIDGGIQAIDECVRLNVPICATEVFAVSQALYIAEQYVRSCEKYGNAPYIAITHISGIFDEYLTKTAKRENIDIDSSLIDCAGISVARKEFKRLQEHGYHFTMLGGGARGTHHFTELVGGPHVTINWSTAREIMDGNMKVSLTVENEVPGEAIRELCDKLPDYRRAYEDDGLTPGEYAGYGPVQLFRNAFLKGWYDLLAHIASRKHLFAL
jgi:transaldolase